MRIQRLLVGGLVGIAFATFNAPPGTAAERSMEDISQEEVRAAVRATIDKNTQANGGLFVFRDNRLGEVLRLEYEDIRVVRGIRGYGFFPNVIFRVKDLPEKKYALDFWLKPKGDGLELMDIRIQKGPKKDGDTWTMVTRMPVAWWWIPASEHPGETEEKRAWEVMSAVHEHIAKTGRENNGVYTLKDDKTGEDLALEFVEIHQPVRKLSENGRFFACTDFRRKGSQDEYYDIDFWLDNKSGAVTVGDVRVHKVPQKEDGVWVQMPRYNFDNLKYEQLK
ncbi:MAG TPA: hypothetical protein VLT62_18650 [Candidatus Methylomirabilis sp.]|nr:hypothetical protein [Candidatus Methylomirabilis sp.]